MAQALRFEWDSGKDRLDQRRHGVSFAEAASVFVDDQALLIDDPDHSRGEDRFVLLDLSSSLRVLLVCHCRRAEGGLVRLISARKVDRQEQLEYFGRFQS